MVAPRTVVHPHEYPEVCAMAAAGYSDAQIADKLNMHVSNFKAALVKNRKLAHAYQVGTSTEEKVLVDTLRTQASDPAHPKSTDAAKFLLKTKHKFRETDPAQTNVNVDARTVSIEFPKTVRGANMQRLVRELSGPPPESGPVDDAGQPALEMGIEIDGHRMFKDTPARDLK
jgi:hypothetical protein